MHIFHNVFWHFVSLKVAGSKFHHVKWASSVTAFLQSLHLILIRKKKFKNHSFPFANFQHIFHVLYWSGTHFKNHSSPSTAVSQISWSLYLSAINFSDYDCLSMARINISFSSGYNSLRLLKNSFIFIDNLKFQQALSYQQKAFDGVVCIGYFWWCDLFL